MKELVNSPKHYNLYPIEAIDMAIKIWGKEKVKDAAVITAFFYRMRLGLKDGIEQELAKEKWWLEKYGELCGQEKLVIDNNESPENITTSPNDELLNNDLATSEDENLINGFDYQSYCDGFDIKKTVNIHSKHNLIDIAYHKLKTRYQFLQNNSSTRNSIRCDLVEELNYSNAFSVVCDEQNNQPDVVDLNCVVATIFYYINEELTHTSTRTNTHLIFGKEENFHKIKTS